MNDKKHIDRLFQEKLKDFEATPSHAVWENISAELKADKKDRKVIPLWLKISAIAAVLLLLFTVGSNVFNTSDENPEQNTIVDTNTNSDTDLNNTNPDNKESDLIDNNSTLEQDKLASEKVDDNSESKTSTRNSESNKLVTPNNKASKTVVVNNSNNKSNPTQKFNKSNVKEALNSTKKDALAQTTKLDEKNEAANNASENNQINKDVIDATLNKNNNSENAIANTTSKENNNVSESGTDENGEVAKEQEKKSIEEALAKNKVQDDANDDKKKKKIEDRWKVSPSIAPVYFNTLGAGSSLHEQFNENSKTGDVNMSYGVRGSYALNDNLSVRAGVNKVVLGYSTNDIFTLRNVSATPTDDRLQLRNVKMKEDIDVVSFISAEGFAYAQIPSVLSDQVIGSIDQKLGFIEIPLELEYELSDQKLGLRVLGGFSALFLNENEVFSTLNGETTLIGEATNINKTSFSANLGVGLDFKLSEKFKLNLEPTFKYQLNTFNNTSGDFKPYFIGIYSGFSFKF
ncbi:MAG: hypothetical protein R2785_07065 [Flavobacteriaceae bacterium]